MRHNRREQGRVLDEEVGRQAAEDRRVAASEQCVPQRHRNAIFWDFVIQVMTVR